jgi:predicted lactoylglutathione lyase
MRAKEFINESKTTLNNMYGGHFPDRDEEFWDMLLLVNLGKH